MVSILGFFFGLFNHRFSQINNLADVLDILMASEIERIK